MRISSLSKEYIKVEVECNINPTTDVVQFAFIASSTTEPVSGDWVAGSWVAGTTSPYTCRCLVGPSGDKTLTDGTYYVWVKITDSPEIPVRKLSETLVVY